MSNKKILVPHDGDEMSDKALKYAIDVAKAMNMEIILLRVIAVVDFSNVPLEYDTRRKLKRELAEGREKAQALAYNKLSKQLNACNKEGVKAKRVVVTGDVVGRILSVADKEDPYMIVMGSRRFKGLAKLKALGSVARRVSEEARCPVTIVR